MTTDITEPEPRFERFRIVYPSGTTLDRYWLLEGGGTLREVALEHPMAVVEPVEDSRVGTPGD
jgi:hypothetical protein